MLVSARAVLGKNRTYYQRAQSFSSMRYLFYDVETTGLPEKGATCPKDSSKWPRIVQIAWTNYTSSGSKVSGDSMVIKPDGYVISDEVAKIHRITQSRAEAEGKPLKEVLGKVAADIGAADVIICHNTEFDINVLNSEFHRNGYYSDFAHLSGKRSICTMKETIDFCALGPKRYGSYKFPRLEELHMKLFGEGMVDAHDAEVDTDYLAKCFFELVRIGVMSVDLDPADFWFTFGKYKGKNLVDIYFTKDGRSYIMWLMKQKWFPTKYYRFSRACNTLVEMAS